MMNLKVELKWGLVGLIGALCLLIGYYVKPLFFLIWFGIPLVFVSLFFGYKDRKKVLT